MDAEHDATKTIPATKPPGANGLGEKPGHEHEHNHYHHHDDPMNDPARRLTRTTTFGASILKTFNQTFNEVKRDATRIIGRSRSVSVKPALRAPMLDGVATKKKKHARSLSELERPMGLVHSESAPAVLDGVSGGMTRPLSDVEDVVMSPLVQSGPSPVSVWSNPKPRVSTIHRKTLADVQQALSPVAESVNSQAQEIGNAGDGHAGAGDVVVPQLLQLGTPMTKVSSKKHKKAVFRLDADMGQIVWESKKHKIIPIENIKEIRTGVDARYYREQFQLSQDYEDRWLTIVYILDGNYKTLHLIVATRDVFKLWETTLRQLHAIRKELMTGLGNLEMRQALWEKHYWKGADEERDHKLTFEEVEKLCKRLNINSSKEDLSRLFQKADSQRRGYLDFEDFRRFVKLLKGRPEVHRLYNKLKQSNGGKFDFGVFEGFMREKQQSKLGKEELQALFTKYATSCDGEQLMSLEAFNSFLLSPDNAVFSDQHSLVHHDMTRPLPEYFISSSHNTYLVGHQLVGDSTIEGYIRALLHSCRTVEVDIYDGDVEPMIFHGKTFTSKVSLREVCEAIKKYGFVASPYPIIISAEVHCSLPFQDMIASIMISVFGDSLVKDDGGKKIEELPSPEDLKGKIMLKTKNLFLVSSDNPSDSDSSFTDMSSASASEGELTSDIETKKKKKQSEFAKVGATVLQRVKSIRKPTASPSKPLGRVQSRTNSAPVVTTRPPPLSIARRLSENGQPPTPTTPAPKPKMSLALVALLVYTVGVKCRGLNKKEVYAPEHMFSLSENMVNKMIGKGGMMDLIKHTRTHLVRTYPKGTRVSSSNYAPHRFWVVGAQLVAINWQTFDLGYMINHAMFQRNGRSGYVLKPLALRAGGKELLSRRTQHVFEVTIISAQQLPRPKNALGHEIMSGGIVDPFVEVSIYIPDWPSIPKKEATQAVGAPPIQEGVVPGRVVTLKTSIVKNNGFNPVWEEKLALPFECVGDMMDLVFVRFVVRKEDDKEGDEPLAVYCASLGSLGRGYRHLPLHDSQLSQFLFSTLFVRIGVWDL